MILGRKFPNLACAFWLHFSLEECFTVFKTMLKKKIKEEQFLK